MKQIKEMKLITGSFKRVLLSFGVMAFVFLLDSCRQDPPPPSNGNCEQSGTIELVPCADGAWGNLWIRTSNGKLLKPCKVLVQGFTPADGMKILFSAADPAANATCVEIPDNEHTCVRAPQYDMLKVITCIKPVAQNTVCNTLATVKQVALDGCKWVLILDDGTKLEPYGIPETFVLQDGMRVSIAFDDHIKVASICMMGKPARILCIQRVRMCGTLPPTACTPVEVGDDPKDYGNFFTIQKTEVSGNCLHITVGFSGCSDKNRKFALVWDGKVNPGNATDFFNVSLIDRGPNEVCEAYFTKTYSFDISKLLKQSGSGNKYGSIKIAGYNEPVHFTY